MPKVEIRDNAASDLGPDLSLWYFREYMDINSQSWQRDLVYPLEAGDHRIIDKGRRGELFYYMHQQLIARYNMERFSNNLNRVTRFNNFRDPIAEGYFQKMYSLAVSRASPAGFDDAQLADLNCELDQISLKLGDLEKWRDLIFEEIHQGFVVDVNGNHIELDGQHGIDILGKMMEASIMSPNQTVYGNFDNMCHAFISYCHEPDHCHLEPFGVIATGMPHPVFYRWHAYIDDFFQEHKTRLPVYTLPQLQYDGISISGIQVSVDGGKLNVLTTFWQESNEDLSPGMGYKPRGNVTRLQHAPFTYTINVNNDGGVQRFGTVRIFMAPKTDELGQPMMLRDQRLMMVQMDKFIVALNPGQNTIRRRCTRSSVNNPFDRNFRNLDQNCPAEGSAEKLEFNFCGYGWPNHMLMSKGRADGLCCELFVMVSNYEDDRVDQDLVGSGSDAGFYGDIRDSFYADRRSMGYPFDRLPRQGADCLANFLTPNMSVVDVVIRHDDDRTVVRQN